MVRLLFFAGLVAAAAGLAYGEEYKVAITCADYCVNEVPPADKPEAKHGPPTLAACLSTAQSIRESVQWNTTAVWVQDLNIPIDRDALGDQDCRAQIWNQGSKQTSTVVAQLANWVEGACDTCFKASKAYANAIICNSHVEGSGNFQIALAPKNGFYTP